MAATCEHAGVKGHCHCSVYGKDFDADHNEITDLVIPVLTNTENNNNSLLWVLIALAILLVIECSVTAYKVIKDKKEKKNSQTKTYSFAGFFLVLGAAQAN